MMTAIQPYLDMILKERSWSWAVICLLYILAALFVRGWFTGSATAQIKLLDRPTSHALMSYYVKASIWGWLFFLIPLILIVIYWRKDALPIVPKDEFLIFLGAVSLTAAIILHLQAYATAALKTLRDRQETKLPEV